MPPAQLRAPRIPGTPPAARLWGLLGLALLHVGPGCDQQDAWTCCQSVDGSSCRCDVRAYDDTSCAADERPTDTCNTDVVADGVSAPYCCVGLESCHCHGASGGACGHDAPDSRPACPGSLAPDLCSAEPGACEEDADCNCGQACLETGDEAMPMACAFPCEDDAECALISEALTVPMPSCVARGDLQLCE